MSIYAPRSIERNWKDNRWTDKISFREKNETDRLCETTFLEFVTVVMYSCITYIFQNVEKEHFSS